MLRLRATPEAPQCSSVMSRSSSGAMEARPGYARFTACTCGARRSQRLCLAPCRVPEPSGCQCLLRWHRHKNDQSADQLIIGLAGCYDSTSDRNLQSAHVFGGVSLRQSREYKLYRRRNAPEAGGPTMKFLSVLCTTASTRPLRHAAVTKLHKPAAFEHKAPVNLECEATAIVKSAQ